MFVFFCFGAFSFFFLSFFETYRLIGCSWFDREVFADVDMGSTNDADDAQLSKKPKGALHVDHDISSDEEEEEEEKPQKAGKRGRTSNAAAPASNGKRKRAPTEIGDEDEDSGEEKEDGGFEEVPIEKELDISDDDNARAEILALGQLVIRKKTRDQLVNESFNRYSQNGMGGQDLPEWFKEDEKRNNIKSLPITKEDVDAFKMQLKAIDARPIRKIAEAKARKKYKAAKRWEKLKTQAESVSENAALSDKDKIKTIEKLYSKSKSKKKKVERTYVVAKKSGGRAQSEARKSVKGPVKVVDKRMKKDKRALKAKEKRRR